jgi:carbonic anhydrase
MPGLKFGPPAPIPKGMKETTEMHRRAQAVRAARPAIAPAASALATIMALAAMALLAPSPARADDATLAAVAPAPTPAQDPMSHLKRRLQDTLGARLADDARGTHELEVPLRRPAPAPAQRAARAPAAAAPAAPSADLAARVAAHRAGKAAAGRGGWGYDGPHGPAHWSELHPDYALCGHGERQSPIDLRDGIAVDLHPVRFDYRPSRFSVIDNGHTVQVQVQVGTGNWIEVGGRRYELQQFHFHRPSEERIEGRQFEMSAHLVHRDAEGRLAVVAVVLERGPALPTVQQVWNDLPLEKQLAAPGHGELDPAGLLPADRRYYTYMGSLTTPPCTEGVLWMVMQQPVTASVQQIDIFSRLYPMNARPVQRAAGRLVKQSN